VEAKKKNVAVIHTETGLAVMPLKNGEVLKSEIFEKLLEKEQKECTVAMEEIQDKVQDTLSRAPQWKKEHPNKIRKLGREATEFVVRHLIDELKIKYQDILDVRTYLEEVHQDVVRNAQDFLPGEMTEPQGLSALLKTGSGDASPMINIRAEACAHTVGRGPRGR